MKYMNYNDLSCNIKNFSVLSCRKRVIRIIKVLQYSVNLKSPLIRTWEKYMRKKKSNSWVGPTSGRSCQRPALPHRHINLMLADRLSWGPMPCCEGNAFLSNNALHPAAFVSAPDRQACMYERKMRIVVSYQYIIRQNKNLCTSVLFSLDFWASLQCSFDCFLAF